MSTPAKVNLHGYPSATAARDAAFAHCQDLAGQIASAEARYNKLFDLSMTEAQEEARSRRAASYDVVAIAGTAQQLSDNPEADAIERDLIEKLRQHEGYSTEDAPASRTAEPSAAELIFSSLCTKEERETHGLIDPTPHEDAKGVAFQRRGEDYYGGFYQRPVHCSIAA